MTKSERREGGEREREREKEKEQEKEQVKEKEMKEKEVKDEREGDERERYEKETKEKEMKEKETEKEVFAMTQCPLLNFVTDCSDEMTANGSDSEAAPGSDDNDHHGGDGPGSGLEPGDECDDELVDKEFFFAGSHVCLFISFSDAI